MSRRRAIDLNTAETVRELGERLLMVASSLVERQKEVLPLDLIDAGRALERTETRIKELEEEVRKLRHRLVVQAELAERPLEP